MLIVKIPNWEPDWFIKILSEKDIKSQQSGKFNFNNGEAVKLDVFDLFIALVIKKIKIFFVVMLIC
jgi:hypothetical protein